MTKKLAILGVGGIGGVTGGYLTRAGHDVTLIDQWPENVETMRTKGLTVTSHEEEFTVHPNALHLCEVAAAKPRFDAVILAVKSYDTEWSVRFIEPYLVQGGFFVSAQNGINDDAIAALMGWSRVIGCVVTLGAEMSEPGHARRTSPAARPAFTLGEPSGLSTPRLTEMTDILGAVGTTKTTSNLWGERWSKLTINAMSNAVAGLTGVKSAELREKPEPRRTSIRIASEVVRVGTALGVRIEPIGGIPPDMFVDAATDGAVLEDLESRLVDGAKLIGTGRPSLAQDVHKGRRTEVDFLNGYISRKGIEAGIATPSNDSVVRHTKRLESGEIPQSLDNLKLID